jgi:chorismate-pyruvate lyase
LSGVLISTLDILEKLEGIEANSLNPLQRILIITDGTLTEILEATFLEQICLIKIAQQTIAPTAAHVQLAPVSGDIFLERKILLQGVKSSKNYVYAESIIALNRLPPLFGKELMNSNTSLGRLWLEHKLETFKELLEVRQEKADDLSKHFNCKTSDILLVRTYRVISAAAPIMIISEYFPVEYVGNTL